MYYGIGGFLVLIVAFQAFSFYYRYTFQRPVWQAELYNESERKLALYLLGSDTKYSINSVNPFSYYLSYLFLSSLTVEEVNASQRELNKNNDRYQLRNNVFNSCKINSIDLTKAPSSTIIDEACLTEKAKNILENSTTFSYETILYSDVNPLRSGKGVKFYIFN